MDPPSYMQNSFFRILINSCRGTPSYICRASWSINFLESQSNVLQRRQKNVYSRRTCSRRHFFPLSPVLKRWIKRISHIASSISVFVIQVQREVFYPETKKKSKKGSLRQKSSSVDIRGTDPMYLQSLIYNFPAFFAIFWFIILFAFVTRVLWEKGFRQINSRFTFVIKSI